MFFFCASTVEISVEVTGPAPELALGVAGVGPLGPRISVVGIEGTDPDLDPAHWFGVIGFWAVTQIIYSPGLSMQYGT